MIPDADRRPPAVTVVLSDLVGSTSLGERLDPEALREVLSRYFETLREAVARHGGRVEKVIGDAMVAAFGPSGDEAADALRAVSAARAAQRALAVLNRQLEQGWGVSLTSRTGVGTGALEIGEQVAGGRVLGGEALELAAILERSAPPGGILVADATRRLVGDSIDARPAEAPVPAHLLLGVSVAYRMPPRRALGAVSTARETRRSVTIVFADARLAGTGHDPVVDGDARAAAMSRWFELARRVLAEHGGTVEAFIGDTVMAVFGLPRRSEDDALRAVRAAAGLRDATPALDAGLRRDLGVSLALRVGVNTGRVVAGDGALGQRLATGDAVNLAARLQGAAAPGEVIVGPSTLRLVGQWVRTEPLEPLTLRGKSAPISAARLVVVAVGDGDAGPRAPFLGREREMAALLARFEGIRDDGARAASVIAEAGVGKSRLVAEFLDVVGGAADVLRGRCLSYGEGITFWPVVEILRGAAGITAEDPPELAVERLWDAAEGVDEDVIDRVAAVMGLSETPFQVGELFAALSSYLGALAGRGPTVVVVDDVHWAEETLLDLLEYLADGLAAAPVLLVTTAREELLDRRPEWAQADGWLRLDLGPLTEEDCARVVDGILGGAGLPRDVRDRIVRAAAGNPLFLEQLVTMLLESGRVRLTGGGWEVRGDLSTLAIPPNVEALVAARIDELPPSQKGVIEPASVIGAEFSRAAVEALVSAPASDGFDGHLEGLVARRLVSRVTEDGSIWDHRFGHGMIRDVVYDGLLLRERAQLHERLVDWADGTGLLKESTVEAQELAGYHLERAFRYRAELGRLDDHAVRLGRRAAERLAPAGRRALARGDMPAAASLLSRAAGALPEADSEVPALLLLAGEAQMEAGLFDASLGSLGAAERLAGDRRDSCTATAARLERVRLEYTTGARQDDDGVAAEADRGLAECGPAGDHAGQARAWRLRAYVELTRSQWGAAEAAALEMVASARRAGDDMMAARVIPALAAFSLCGPTPVVNAIARCEALLADVAGDRRAEALIGRSIAHMTAMRGDFAAAREGYRGARTALAELGWRLDAALVSLDSGPVEMLAGDDSAAEAELRADFEALWAMGERNYVATTAALLAEALLRQGRLGDAAEYVRISRETAGEGDVSSHVLWRAVEGRLQALGGDPAAGMATCREALAMIEETDDVNTHADVLCALAEVAGPAGRRGERRGLLEQAQALYRRKGNVVAGWRVRAALQADAGAG